MGLKDKLKVVLHLDTKGYTKKAKKAKGEIKDIGGEAKRTSDVSDIAFAKIGAGIAAAGAIAIATAAKITKVANEIARAADEAARIEAIASRSLAQEVGGEDVTRIAALFGQTGQQFNRFTAQLGARFDLSQQQVRETLEPIGARITDPTLRQAATTSALTLGRTRGVFGEAAGLLPPLLVEQFGAKTPGDIQRGIAGIASAAELSAIPAPAFGAILTTAAATLKKGGVGLREQVGLISGFAPFFPTRPTEIGTGLQRIGELRLRKSPFLKQLLQSQGFDPETRNPIEILQGINQYARAGGDMQRLQSEGQVPFEVIRLVEKAEEGAFAEAQAIGLREFDIGAGDPGVESRRLAGALATPESQIRRGEAAANIPTTAFGAPGTALEALDILGVLKGRAAGGISRTERLGFRTRLNQAQQALLVGGKDFTEEQALELQSLNALYPGVIASLNRLLAGRSPIEEGVDIRSLAGDIINSLSRAHTEANTTTVFRFGDQVERLAEYANQMRAAIRFIRQAELGQNIDARSILGAGSGDISVSPTSEQAGVAGAATAGGFDVTKAAGISAQTVIINQTGPESKPNTNRTKTDRE